MKIRHQDGTRVDRRTTIKWLAATMVAANTGCSSNGRFVGEEIPPAPVEGTALLGTAMTPDGISYGTDPNLMPPSVPWSRTMTASQLETASALCDYILPADSNSPAASTVGVPDFIDEWISAPYGQQQCDREIILAGLEWLELESRNNFGRSFMMLDSGQATSLLDRIALSGDEAADQAAFFDRFRYLSVGAFYTTEAGIADIGYIGNVPLTGDYPGPSAAAMSHLAGVLDELGLSLPG